ncbi:MAG TPA: class D sortase [Epulopiscium sp.]|nr:class D sortase [Candidatus Epulonipiscium sp.]
MKRKVISALLIVTGLLVVAYPKISDIYLNYRQDKLMQEWEQILTVVDNHEEDQEVEQVLIKTKDQVNVESVDDQFENRREEFNEKGIEGILSIEKIELSLPILTGSTKGNLRKSVASVEKTGKLGEVGNYAIAGHRNRTYGSIFNRLDEVSVGDHIGLNNGEEQYDYTVVEKLYVKPEEVWVLNGNKTDKEVTLITCHPRVNPTHRLIIKGKIVE